MTEINKPERSLAFYQRHGALSLPGRHAAALRGLPDDLPSLLGVVQGLLLHSDLLPFYRLSADDFPAISRTTLPLAERLDEIVARDPALLTAARPPRARALATCRDYAVMLTGILREKGWVARVRCGFAAYFTPGRYEDHWVCEYWCEREAAWQRADAQLDAVHRSKLNIAFDPTRLPAGAFLNAAQAWRAWRAGQAEAGRFGHGEASGPHFLLVNLARDCLALAKQETSDWDRWREALPWADALAPAELRRGDELAQAIQRFASAEPDRRLPQPFNEREILPFWRCST